MHYNTRLPIIFSGSTLVGSYIFLFFVPLNKCMQSKTMTLCNITYKIAALQLLPMICPIIAVNEWENSLN